MSLRPDGKETASGPPELMACDVLVVGAGPAGSTAAATAAAAGAAVILIERRGAVGSPPRCAGYIPARLAEHLELPREAISQRVRRMVTHTPAGVEETADFGYIVERDIFDRQLAQRAVAAGTRLLTGTRADSHEGGITSIHSAGVSGSIKARVVIGADGPRSRVGSWIASRSSRFLAAAQWTVRLRATSDAARVYFQERILGGYGWLFPRGGSANLGIAVAYGSGIRPLAVLADFAAGLERQGMIVPEPRSATGGLIPVGGPLDCRRGRVLLAGDAAGLCHPITGAGIAAAIQSGELAGRAAAQYVNAGKEDVFDEYTEEIEDLFGDALRHATRRRGELESAWGGSEADFYAALERSWVAYPGYRDNDDC